LGVLGHELLSANVLERGVCDNEVGGEH
jgi:hypothetical protein